MRNWIYGLDDKDSSKRHEQRGRRFAVVHCKAGKGRSGTIACGYLISEEGWTLEDALQRFTERRMRVGFGAGVSIPSQLRWVRYIERWASEMGKNYVERPVELLELHLWGLKDGVKVAIEGFVDEGKKVKCFHLFHRSERTVIDDGKTVPAEKKDKNEKDASKEQAASSLLTPGSSSELVKDVTTSSDSGSSTTSAPKHTSAIILRPSKPLILPSSDVNIDFERRTKAPYAAVVTSIAHVWFNAYFEGGDKYESGVFETEWDALDGIKGTTKKGVRALDRLKVVWRYAPPSRLDETEPAKEDIGPALGKTLSEPKPGEPVPESGPADWRGADPGTDPEHRLQNQENISRTIASKDDDSERLASKDHSYISGASTAAATAASATARSVHGVERELGLRRQADGSNRGAGLSNTGGGTRAADVSKADGEDAGDSGGDTDLEGVKSYFGENGNSKLE